VGGKRRCGGKGGKMTQSLYAHMNKGNKKNKQNKTKQKNLSFHNGKNIQNPSF
jgi:hypothetical protein